MDWSRITLVAGILALVLFLTRELWYPGHLEKSILRKVMKMYPRHEIQTTINGHKHYVGCSITWTGSWLVTITDDDAALPPFIETIRQEVVRTKKPETDILHETSRLATLLLNQRFRDSY